MTANEFLNINNDLILYILLTPLKKYKLKKIYYIEILANDNFCLISREDFNVVKIISYKDITDLVLYYKIKSLKNGNSKKC